MRPPSILMFERLFLASLVGSVVSTVNGYGAAVDQLARDPNVSAFGLGGGIVIGVFAFWMALYLLLWFLIARMAVNAAKWILLVLVVLTLLALPGSLGWPLDWADMVDLTTAVLQIAALAYLFRGDARLWLQGTRPADPAAFD